MRNYPIILMCVMLALASIACNLGTPAGATVELTEVADDPVPTATAKVTRIPTQDTNTDNSDSGDSDTNDPANDNLQVQPTAELPPVTLPLIGSDEKPPSSSCSVAPAQSGTLVNVRRGADLGYEAFFQLKGYATVNGVFNGWYQIPLDGGFIGYVSDTVTKLHGDCDFLFPTPIPDRDPNRCYLDIPLMVGIEVFYFSEPQPSGSQSLGKMTTLRMAIEAYKSGWYRVTNVDGITGWVPRDMGSTTGACDDIPDLSPQTPICLIVAYYDGNAYYTPFTTKNRFGTVTAGEAPGAVAKTIDGWYGFDPGIAQAPNEGLDRLRWVYPNHTNVFQMVGDCDAIETVYDQVSDWNLVISPTGDVPDDGCYVQSIAPIYTNYVFGGTYELPEVIGVLNTYAPFAALGDHGYVIELPGGGDGWVSRDKVRFIGDACPA